MPVEESQEEMDSPKKTRGGKTHIKEELISPTETTVTTPARRMTRKTSQLEDKNEASEEASASPMPTRRSSRTRKNTVDDTFDYPIRRSTRRGTGISPTEPQVGTPKRITRRTASIQSDTDNTPSETPNEEEEAPVSRRTRANSITSDDGSVTNVGTPKKRGRKSLAASVKPIEPVIEESEETQSPVRPVTRSLSKSPANLLLEGSPTKAKSPLVSGTPEKTNGDDTIIVLAKEISRSLSNKSPQSPDVLKSPVGSKTPQKNESLMSSGKKGEKSPAISKTPQKNENLMSSGKKGKQSPAVSKTPQKNDSLMSSGKKGEKTPTSAASTPKSTVNETPESPIKTPVIDIPKETTPGLSAKESPSTPVSATSAKKTEYISQTPQPTKSERKNDAFSKSWSQPIHGKAAITPKIDTFSVKQTSKITTSVTKIRSRTIAVSDSDDDSDEEPDNDFEEFVEDQAEVVINYESGDSMDEDEKEVADENRMHEELGEDIGSEDTDSNEDEEYENDSFIASEGELDLLSYSDDDEHFDTSKGSGKKLSARKSAPARVMVLDSSDDSDDEKEAVVKKSQSEKKLPKIILQQRISTGDPDISCKPVDKTLFNSSAIENTSKVNITMQQKDKTIHEEDEPMDVDESIMSPKKSLFNHSVKSGQKTKTPNKSPQKSKNDDTESIFEFSEPTIAQVVAAESSLLNLSKKNNRILQSDNSKSPSLKALDSETSVNLSQGEVPELNESINETEVEENNKKDSSSDSSSDEDEMEVQEEPKESESAKRKRKRRTAGFDESMNDHQSVKKTKMNVSLVSNEKLDTILEKCNEILKTKKEDKKKKKLLHKKEKEEKKKRKELLKQQEQEESQENDGADTNDDSLKKKKKKQKIGRKYNQEIEEPSTTKQEQVSKALKRSQELLEKKRERKRLKKLAKLEKAKAEGVEIVKKPKAKENGEVSSKKRQETEKQEPKKKTLLTAYEVKQRLFQESSTESVSKEKPIQTPVTDDSIPDKENTEKGVSKKLKKKKTKVLEPVQDSNNSDTNSPPLAPANKRMLGILSAKGVLNKQGFIVDPVTPEADRLKRNRGFVEEPATPKPIGFKVQSMMPSGQEFVKKANKKRKRSEIDIPEPSRLPPKPVWTASGAFEVSDAPEISDYIPLSTNARAATQFGVSMLGKKNAKESHKNVSQGLSNFKMKALYSDKSRMRESSKDLARKLEKQKIYKGLST